MTEAERTLGPFNVTTARENVEAFAEALGLHANDVVPLTYPVRMLAEEPIASAISGAVPNGAAVLHQAQRFVSHSPLKPDQTYRLDLQLSTARERRSKLTIKGTITDAQNRLMQEFAATLILLERP
jgi:hypothetical protein